MQPKALSLIWKKGRWPGKKPAENETCFLPERTTRSNIFFLTSFVSRRLVSKILSPFTILTCIIYVHNIGHSWEFILTENKHFEVEVQVLSVSFWKGSMIFTTPPYQKRNGNSFSAACPLLIWSQAVWPQVQLSRFQESEQTLERYGIWASVLGGGGEAKVIFNFNYFLLQRLQRVQPIHRTTSVLLGPKLNSPHPGMWSQWCRNCTDAQPANTELKTKTNNSASRTARRTWWNWIRENLSRWCIRRIVVWGAWKA